ncbi:hypothetical protein [Humidesulfovibrio idahonensis]
MPGSLPNFEPAPAPLPKFDASTIIGYDLASGPDRTAILINGHPLTEADRAMLLRLLCADTAPLPETAGQAVELLHQYAAEAGPCDHDANICVCGILRIADALEEVYSAQARRVAELEAERDEAERTNETLRDLLDDAEEERKAGWQLAGDAARGLNVMCDGDLGHEAEQIRAARKNAEAELQRIMEWARGRCSCCSNHTVDCRCCVHGNHDAMTDFWTPPRAWEGK